MVQKALPLSALEQPVPLTRYIDDQSPAGISIEEKAVDSLLSSIYLSKRPVVLVDSLVVQFGVKSLVRSLIENLKFATFCPFMGKSIIEEAKDYFYGTYNGKFSFPGIQKAVEEESDLVIHIGPLLTDMNTGGFSANIDSQKLVLVEETRVICKGEVFEGVYLKPCKFNRPISLVYPNKEKVLTRLMNSLDVFKVPKTPPLQFKKVSAPPVENKPEDSVITQAYLWPRMGNFFRKGDIVFADGGTTHFGLQDAEFPDITYIMQNHWASIGYALPAAFGGAMAKRDISRSKTSEWNGIRGEGNGRVILLTGEGAMQLTVQEVGNMIREGLDVIM